MAKERAESGLKSKNISLIIKNIRHREEVNIAFKQMQSITKGVQAGIDLYIKVQHPVTCGTMYQSTISSLKSQPP
eukprot:4270942-Ditylum_brightwellii.AAC.1